MARKEVQGKRLFVLDTNVLMHDPTALFRFHEHDIFLPMVVLEELDAGKKGLSEVARNVRQVSRFLDDLVSGRGPREIEKGLPLQEHRPDLNGKSEQPKTSGRLFFQTRSLEAELPDALPGNRPDNNILGTALALQNTHPDKAITLVSKDINLRIKATAIGIHAEDYFNDQVLDDVNLLYSGTYELPGDFWEQHSKDMESWQENGRNFYRLTGPLVSQWHPNQCLHLPGDSGFEALVRSVRATPPNCRSPSTTAAASTPCGASMPATWSRTSPSTCSWIRRWISCR
jgi:PhoH-like ATPase